MQRRDPFRHFVRPLTIAEENPGFLSFRNFGGNDYGLLLDLVRIRERGENDPWRGAFMTKEKV
jgi:hypothetical protein